MEIRQLKTFHAVATLMSFHGAAKALNYAQSTVSAQIQALEDDLDVKLFERIGRRISLTEAGVKLLKYASKMVDLEGEARAEVAEGAQAQGRLNIRMPESFCMLYLSEILQQFRKIHPEMQLIFSTCAHDELPEDLRKGVTDVAFLMAESFNSCALAMETLGMDSVVLVGRRKLSLAGQLVVTNADLAGQPLFLVRTDCSYRKMVEALFARKGFRPAHVVELSSLGALMRCVAGGQGLAFLPKTLALQEQEAGRLSILDWEEGELEVARMMVHHKEKWLSPPLVGFMEIARSVLGA